MASSSRAPPAPSSRKRNATEALSRRDYSWFHSPRNIIDLTGDTPPPPSPKRLKQTQIPGAAIPEKRRTPPRPSPRRQELKRTPGAPTPEKRRRVFRHSAPQTYLKIKGRALTQRLTVLSRSRYGTDDEPGEIVTVAGSTGNVYTINIGLEPSCDCPHAIRGNQCKHIIYVMLRVLKAPEHIAYQLALVKAELRELMRNAPPVPGVETNGEDGKGKEQDGNRKAIEGECPICYDELDDKEATVYCKSSCGNNVHKSCMQKWTAISKGKATCPYCRATWEVETGLECKLGAVDTKGLMRNPDGYVNVGAQLGLDGKRDSSTYHRWGRYDYDYD